MPVIQVSLYKGRSIEEKENICSSIQIALKQVFSIQHDNFFYRINEYDENQMLVPELLRQNYVLIELDMFSGRSVELKNELFKKLESDLNKFGIKKEYLMIIYRETPIENWYIQGNCGVEIRKILNKNN